MATHIVIQSRLTSSRLPAKAMLSLAGVPLVELVGRRAGNTGLDVTVATSDTRDDDVIADAVVAAGIRVVRGSLEDPLARFVMATTHLSANDIVVRLTADNAVPDGALSSYVADALTGDVAYARIGGSSGSTVPYGVSVEAFRVFALREADENATEAHEREHVTPWIRAHYGDFEISPHDAKDAWQGLRATIDTLDDFVQMSRVFSRVDDPINTSWTLLCDQLLEPQAKTLQRRRSTTTTHLTQSPLILGSAQLGMAYGAANRIGMPEPSTSYEILAAAAASGITHVDTARAYEASETQIGNALHRGLSTKLRVVTKLRPLDALPRNAAPDWGRAEVAASLEASLRALRVNTLDALLTHRADDWHKPGVRAALAHTRDEGVTGVVGVSLSTPEELLAVIEDPLLGYIQLPFNLLDRRWVRKDVAEAFAQRPEVVIVARSVYLQGLLTAGETARWPTNIEISAPSLLRCIDNLVMELDRVSRADLALAYVLAQPWVDSAVVGAEAPEQILDTAAAALRPPLSDEEQRYVRECLPEVPLSLIDPSQWVRS